MSNEKNPIVLPSSGALIESLNQELTRTQALIDNPDTGVRIDARWRNIIVRILLEKGSVNCAAAWMLLVKRGHWTKVDEDAIRSSIEPAWNAIEEMCAAPAATS